MLDLGALRAFYWVGKFGGIAAAARDLKVTQPAVSQRISKLESQLKKKLHGKAGRNLVLTEDGRKLFESCRDIFEAADALEKSLDGTQAPIFGTVRIAALSEFSKAFLLPKINQFRKTHPAVEFDLSYRMPYDMLAALSRHEVDLAFSSDLYRKSQIEMIPFYKETTVCVGPGPSRKLSWVEIAKKTWISCGTDDPLWHEMGEMALRDGVRLPRPALRVADIESILRLVASGAGYALIPSHSLLLSLKGISVQSTPMKAPSSQVYLCHLKTVPLSRAGQAFCGFLAKKPA